MRFGIWFITTIRWLSVIWQEGKNALTTVYNQIEPVVKIWCIWTLVVTIAGLFLIFLLMGASVGIGIFFHTNIWCAAVGIPIALTICVILTSWTPIAALLGIARAVLQGKLIKSIKEGVETGEVYLGIVLKILLVQLLISALLSVVPFWNDWTLIIRLCLVGSIFLLMFLVWGPTPILKKISYVFVTGYFILILATWVIPDIVKASKSSFDSAQIDNQIEENGIIKGGVIGAKNAIWKPGPKSQPVTPIVLERNPGWSSIIVDATPKHLIRIYLQEPFLRHKSKKGFKLKDEEGHIFTCDPSPSDTYCYYEFRKIRPEGENLFIWSEDPEPFQVRFRTSSTK